MRPLRPFAPSLLKAWLGIGLLSLLALPAMAADEAAPDNGTDPTRFSRTFIATWEYFDANDGIRLETLELSYTVPLGEARRWSARATVPLLAVRPLDDHYNVGDVSLQLSHVFGLTRKGAWVAKGELYFDMAEDPQSGTGRNVFKGTLIRAYFLPSKSIFAPALVHSADLGGDAGRSEVNSTTMDFYYVPKLSDPRNLLTWDPYVTVDWERNDTYAGLAVTYGRGVGKMWGGNAIVTAKPFAMVGGERPGDWGVEVGFKVIGF